MISIHLPQPEKLKPLYPVVYTHPWHLLIGRKLHKFTNKAEATEFHTRATHQVNAAFVDLTLIEGEIYAAWMLAVVYDFAEPVDFTFFDKRRRRMIGRSPALAVYNVNDLLNTAHDLKNICAALADFWRQRKDKPCEHAAANLARRVKQIVEVIHNMA